MEDHKLKKQLRGILSAVLRDNKGAWELLSDGTYAKPPRSTPLNFGLASESWDAPEGEIDELGLRSGEIGFQATMQEVTLAEIAKEKKRISSHRAKPKVMSAKLKMAPSGSVHQAVPASHVKANKEADTPDTSGLN